MNLDIALKPVFPKGISGELRRVLTRVKDIGEFRIGLDDYRRRYRILEDCERIWRRIDSHTTVAPLVLRLSLKLIFRPVGRRKIGGVPQLVPLSTTADQLRLIGPKIGVMNVRRRGERCVWCRARSCGIGRARRPSVVCRARSFGVG